MIYIKYFGGFMKKAFTLAEGATHVTKSDTPHRVAFTLAEVLITLGIIGVVAAMTLPTLIQNHQKQQMLTALKKAYTSMSQAIDRAKVDHEDVDTWDYNLPVADFVNTYFIPYLNVAENCGVSESDNNCKIVYKHMNGADGYSNDIYNCILTTDGMQYCIKNSPASEGYPKSILIRVDINGKKNPNVGGKDVFHMRLWTNTKKLSFEGISANSGLISNCASLKNSASNGCNKTATAAGHMCGAYIFCNGWNIPKDYPW